MVALGILGVAICPLGATRLPGNCPVWQNTQLDAKISLPDVQSVKGRSVSDQTIQENGHLMDADTLHIGQMHYWRRFCKYWNSTFIGRECVTISHGSKLFVIQWARK